MSEESKQVEDLALSNGKCVLFTAAGETDPLRGGFDGPILHIVRKYSPEKVYLFLTAEMSRRDRKTNCYEKAIHFLSPECEVEKIYSDIENANDYDAFHTQFDEIINRIHDENPGATLLLNVSSATPQIKTTMCLEVVSHHMPLVPVQVANPERRTGRGIEHFDPEKGDLMDELENLYDGLEEAENRCSVPEILAFRKSIVKNQVKSLIANYDYGSAYALLCGNGIFFSEKAKKLLGHAYNRSKPDHKEAEKIAKSLQLEDLLYPVKESPVRRACEYYLIMKIKSLRGEISDFVLRLDPFAEYLAKSFLEKNKAALETMAKERPGGWYMESAKAEQNHKGLMAYLNDVYQDKGKSGYDTRRFINLDTMTCVMKFKGLDENVIQTFQTFQEFKKLRDQVAHKLEAVTEDDLAQKGKKSGQLCRMIEGLMPKIYSNSIKTTIFTIYDLINKYIIEEMDNPES